MEKYSEMIDKYALYQQDVFLLPDDVMVKDGVACGDYVTIVGEQDDHCLEFKFDVDGCALCRASANYLFETYHNRDIDLVITELEGTLNEIRADRNYLLRLFGVPYLKNRYQCLYYPFEMLHAFAIQVKNKKTEFLDKKDTTVQLDCDACVVTSRIQWTGTKEDVKPRQAEKVYPTEYKEKWGRCAKLYLTEEEIALLKELTASMTPEDYEYIMEEKLSQTIYSNLRKNGIPLTNHKVWRDIIYQVQRKHILQTEIAAIYRFIKEEQLQLYTVKGGYTGTMYTGKDVRVYLDYDLIACSNRDAFRLANNLINRGFTIADGLFSMKRVEIRDQHVYSGHFHIQKVFYSQYQLVIDVNFPAFPMGRVDLFYPEVADGEIIAEDQLLITLCHAFKHKNVYMKDINDIYLMLKTKELNYRILKKRLEENQLQEYASVLFSYLFKNYDLDSTFIDELSAALDLNLELLEQRPGWPFDAESVLELKKEDLTERLKRGTDNERLYLFPLAVFRQFQELDDLQIDLLLQAGYDARRVSENICEVDCQSLTFILIGMGIFIDTYTDVTFVGRKKTRLMVEELLNVIHAREIIDVPFELDEMETWYF